MSLAAFSERVGTALINGSWFVRKLRLFGARTIVMHGHRHIDWIGACGELKIISAPSPVMGVKNEASTYFHIHTVTARLEGRTLFASTGTRGDCGGERTWLTQPGLRLTTAASPCFGPPNRSASHRVKEC